MNKLIYSAFLIYVLLTLVTASAVSLNRRHHKCSCTVAIADFDGSYGSVKGLITYAQDETGCTIVTGIFKNGFEDPSASYKVQIVDRCGFLLYDLTDLGLDIQLCGDGSTKSFSHRFENDFNLDCTSDGILLVEAQEYCETNNKRQLPPPKGTDTQTVMDDQVTGKANNKPPPN